MKRQNIMAIKVKTVVGIFLAHKIAMYMPAWIQQALGMRPLARRILSPSTGLSIQINYTSEDCEIEDAPCHKCSNRLKSGELIN